MRDKVLQSNNSGWFGNPNRSADREIVVMVNVVVAAELAPGVTDAGEKLQEAIAGKPEQVNVTGWAKPFDPDTDKLIAAD
jgi:hypothetical protein